MSSLDYDREWRKVTRITKIIHMTSLPDPSDPKVHLLTCSGPGIVEVKHKNEDKYGTIDAIVSHTSPPDTIVSAEVH